MNRSHWVGLGLCLFFAGAAWRTEHQLTARQSVLLSQMIQLQQDRAATIDSRESTLQQFTTLATHHPGNANLAAANADETARLTDDVQTSEHRWRVAQREFQAISRTRSRERDCLLGLSFLCLLPVARLIFLLMKTRHAAPASESA